VRIAPVNSFTLNKYAGKEYRFFNFSITANGGKKYFGPYLEKGKTNRTVNGV
jgi:hypothetical protein